MEAAFILVPIFVFVIVKMAMDQGSKARADRVRLLEEALKNPAIDRAMLETLTFQLTGQRPPSAPGSGPLLATLLAIGWVALFTGLGVLAIGQILGESSATAGGLLTSIVGFGLVTYPFALRELEGKRHAQ